MQIAPEWWIAYAEGVPYYHNTTTKETTWTAPILPLAIGAPQDSGESTGQPDDGRRPERRGSKKSQPMTDEDQVRRSSRQGSEESTGQADDGR